MATKKTKPAAKTSTGTKSAAKKPATTSATTSPSSSMAGVTRATTFQEVILRLQRFWADRGCLIVQPTRSYVTL